MEKTVYILIGMPASGKSTWREKFLEKNPDVVVASSDDVIERLCEEAGITYDEGWKQFNGKAESVFNNTIRQTMNEGKDLIADRTHMSAKNRRKLVRLAEEKGYRKVAVNFIVPDKVLAERMQTRFEQTGKSVPGFALKGMAHRYEAPTREEGFDEIQTIRS